MHSPPIVLCMLVTVPCVVEKMLLGCSFRCETSNVYFDPILSLQDDVFCFCPGYL